MQVNLNKGILMSEEAQNLYILGKHNISSGNMWRLQKFQ